MKLIDKSEETELLKSSIELLHIIPDSVLKSETSKENAIAANSEIYSDALAHGILFSPKVLTLNTDALNRVVNISKDLFGIDTNKINQSFYHSFEDMLNRSDFELRLEQLFNYMTVYTSEGYAPDPNAVFTANDKPAHLIDVQDELVVINISTDKEIRNALLNLLDGAALSSKMQDDILVLIDSLNLSITESDISNKEVLVKIWAKQWLSDEHGYIPNNDAMVMRLILTVLSAGDITQLVKKDKVQRAYIAEYIENAGPSTKNTVNNLFSGYVNSKGINHVAAISNQYRKFLLEIKKILEPENKTALNAVLHKSTKLGRIHKNQSSLDNIIQFVMNQLALHVIENGEYTSTSDMLSKKTLKQTVKDVYDELDHANNYKLIKIINAMNFNKEDSDYRYFIIRNGKSFLTKINPIRKTEFQHALYEMVVTLAAIILKDRISKTLDGQTIYLPEEVNYALPTSAKTLIGSLPYMSKMSIKSQYLTTGVSWSQEDDIDLHAYTLSGDSIGWDGDYRNEGVFYSGDMTALVNGNAAEYMLLNNKQCKEPVIFSANWFNASSDMEHSSIDYDLFISGHKFNHDKRDWDSSNDVSYPEAYLNGHKGSFTQMVNKVDKSTLLVKGITNTNKQRSRNLIVAIPTADGWDVIVYGQSFADVNVPNIDVQQALLTVLQTQDQTVLRLKEFISDIISDEDNTDSNHIKLITNSEDLEKYKKECKEKAITVNYMDLSLSKINPTTLLNLFTENK